ncbi:hypothetical protein ACIHCQ_00980 [Streptomyces sp. NPDC052236]|uniref:hypothetical protein n=1 Tax=Streptomyces sp. NPDC052236 TaxID=3365686 RepID=UPI0037D76211
MAGGYGFDVGAFKQLFVEKTQHATLVKKVNDLNFTVDYIKIGLAGVALGITAVKIDFTLFKVDEKGISLFGKTFRTWPWAEEGGGKFWRKFATKKEVQKFDTKTARNEAVDAFLKKLKNYDTKTERTKAVHELRRSLREFDKKKDRVAAIQQLERKTARRISQLKTQTGGKAGQPDVDKLKTDLVQVEKQISSVNNGLRKLREELGG